VWAFFVSGGDGETRSGAIPFLHIPLTLSLPKGPTDKKHVLNAAEGFIGFILSLSKYQRLDATGLYYYNARYYDATIGRFISPDTIIQSPANPQTINRYSYSLNNPLKYIDPSGHIVEINGWNVQATDALLRTCPYMPSEMVSLVTDVVASPLYQAYDTLRSIDNPLTSALESAKETVTIQSGTPSNGWAAEYNPNNNTITLNKNSDLCSYDSITKFVHEGRHAWQDVVASTLANTTFDQNKWKDVVYAEWDAYKYQADLEDRLGWRVPSPWWSQPDFFQKLDLENSWDDYQIAYNRFAESKFERIWPWKIYTPTFYRQLYLTEDLYNK
jgi:RHS repeat-associated protein